MMDKEQVERFNRGRRLLVELNELMSRYQKLNFYLDTAEDIDKFTEPVLDEQSLAMKEYIDILMKRIQDTIY